MRVAMVTPSYAPRMGGVETHVQAIAARLPGLGVDVEVLTQGRDRAERRDPGAVTVRTFPSVVPSDAYPVAPGLWAWLHAARHDFDLVHVHGYHGIAALAGASATSLPVVFTPHYHGGGHTRFARVLHLGYRHAGSWVFSHASRVVAVSAAEAGLVGDHHPRVAGKLRVIPNGVDVAELMDAAPFPTTVPVVVSVGRLLAYKHVEVAVAAMARVEAACELVVVGDGPERPRLERAARSTPARVRVLGPVDDAQRRRWQRSADVVVSLSEHEAFGLTLLEGLAVGARAVATDIPAHREVAGLSGAADAVTFVSTPPDPGEVGAAIGRALAQRRLTVLPARVWTWDAVAEATRLVYEEALER